MKVKRLVSIILAVLLLVGMIPMNAMAAMELESGKTLDKSPGSGEETAYDVARVKLMVSKSFGDKFKGKNGEYDLAEKMEEEGLDTLTAAYNTASDSDKGSIFNTSNTKQKQLVIDNVTYADSAFDTESASQGELEVNPGDIVYLAIKFSVENPQNTMGVVPIIGAFIKYDSNKLEPPNESAYYDNIAVNAISTGLNSRMNSSITGEELTAVLKGYHSSWSLSSGIEISAANEKGERFMGITMTSSDNNKTMLPSESKWELVIPMKVKEGATGTTTLSAVPQGASSEKLCSIDLAPASFSGTYGTDALAPRTTRKPNSDHMVISNDITLKIKATTPGITAVSTDVPTGETTIMVEMNEFAKANANTTNKDYWKVYSGTDFGTEATVTNVAVSGQGITLTVTGLVAGAVKVEAQENALSNQAGTPVASKLTAEGITAVAAPEGSLNHTSGVVTSATQSFKIRYKTSATAWTDWTDNATIPGTALTTLAGLAKEGANTDLVEIALASNTDIKGPVTVTKATKPTATLEVDYDAETTKGGTLTSAEEYSFTSATATDYTAGTGAAVALNPGTAQKTLYYRTKGDTDKFASDAKTLTVPARPTLKVDVVEDETAAKAGATKVNVTGTGAKYELLGASNNGDVSGGQDLSSGVIDGLNADKWLHAQIPASATSFKSNVVNVQGTGWNYVKIDPTSFNLKDEADQTITLTLVGPSSITWVGSESNLTLTKNPSGDSGDFKVKSFSNGTVTFEGTPEKGQDYKLTVAAAAVTGGALNSKAGSSTDVILYGPSDDARNIESDEFTLNAKVSKSGEAKIDLTDQLVGKKIKGVTVTAGQSDVADVTWTDKVITVKGSDTISGKAEENASIKLKIEVESIPLQYPTTESVELGDNTEKTIVPTNASDLTGVTVTVTPADSGLTVDADGLTLKTAGENFQTKGNYEFTLTGSNGATAKITITVTGIAATPDFSEVTKKWDDTDSLTNDNVTGQVKWKDKDGTELTGTYSGTYKLNNTNVGNTANVDVTEGTFTTDDFEYDVAAGTYDVNVVAAEIASVDSVADVNVTAGSTTTVEKVAEEMAKAKVTTTTDTGATVEATLGDVIAESDIKDIIKDKLQQAALPEAEKKARDEWIKEWQAKEENADKTKDEAEAAADAADADIKAAAKAAVEAEIDDNYVIPGGTDLSIELPYTKADGSQVKAKTNAQLSDNVEEANLSDETISVKATVKKKSTGGGGSYVPNVELETNGFGTPDGPVELDENGKISKLPGVIGQKLGTVFKGWATQDGNANTIVKVGREIVADTKLYGIFEGYMNGDKNANGQRTARPSDNVTRGELVTMLVRAVGLYDDSVDYTTSFADAKGAWYTTYVGCAETAGILEGDAEGTARPRDNITREEAAILIAKTFKVDVATGGTTDYVVDFDKTANWAKDYVAAIVNNGTAVGNDHKEYEPKKPITRAEVAAMINKYLGLTAAKKTSLASNSSPFVDVTNSNSWYYAEMLFASLNAPYDYYVTEITYPTR